AALRSSEPGVALPAGIRAAMAELKSLTFPPRTTTPGIAGPPFFQYGGAQVLGWASQASQAR
ncbi:MAG: hypothetical protein ABFC96_14360, partial [Thermoguttaceae bacterium]